MGRSRPSHGFKPVQTGFTLIELLISMVLGMVIIGALIVMYLSGSSATRNAQAQGQMNEDAQMALAVVAHELRQSGYNPTRAAGVKNDLSQNGWGLVACDTGFANNAALTVAALACNPGAGGFALAVAYEGDLRTGRNTTAVPPLPMDCLGNGVAPPVPGAGYYVMQSRLYIANNALTCRGSGDLTQSQVLAENIESMTASFAVSDPTVAAAAAAAAPKTTVGYLTATGINAPANPALLLLPPLERWSRVIAAQICVVVRSENVVLSDLQTATPPTYLDCNNANVNIADGRLRRAYRTTVLLRNHGVGY